MHLWTAVVLGVVQGVTEFLPISSSGHLVLAQKLLGVHDALSFDILLHAGTLIAVCAAFAPELVTVLRNPFGKLSRLIMTAAIPTAVIGLLFRDVFERMFSSGSTLGLEFILSGTILALSTLAANQSKQLEETSLKDAAIIGLLQGVAIMPAISRSGLTIAGALWRGLDREFAAKLSFLVSIPVVLGATVFEWAGAPSGGFMATPAEIAGFIAAAVSGYGSAKYMVKKVARGQLGIFVWYLWILGAIVLYNQLFLHGFVAAI